MHTTHAIEQPVVTDPGGFDLRSGNLVERLLFNNRPVVVAVLPLMLTSILAEALMVVLGIGVKVATLPVIALGVGIGVDYALYILTITLTHMRSGKNLSGAYQGALAFTGKVVVLIALTLAAGVATWGLSSVKFQADMGILLTFMFLLNMVGALVLLPALAHFLLPQMRDFSARALETGVVVTSKPSACH
jgi:predicted RND superfamily exporter protein